MSATESASDDAALVQAASGGDPIAFGRLFERYAKTVHGVLLSRLIKADADDLTQEVFLLAFRKISSLTEPSAFGGWLCAIARNRATDFLRKDRQHVELTRDIPSADPRRAEAEEVLMVIRDLPEAYRESLVLRLVEGMTGPEIAERTGLSQGSVRVNLHRGMRLLRERLGSDDE
ncbi:MAG TPA: sigma-70 family RNA polymerase sigma factor [Polyangiaceae bacterium]|nr:sigma-70 family RNA polymerase sigma factor [Polyangiaceae bacterium]